MGVSQFPLQYRYEPGDQSDGVSVVVPRAIVHQLQNERLEWLVPGLLEEKLTCLIKSLPKRLRRQLVPVPDTVRTLLPKLVQRQSQQAPFWKSICEVLTEFIREPVKQTDFDIASVPEHLRMRVEMVDDRGTAIRASRDLSELQQIPVAVTTGSVAPSASTTAASYDWARTNMDSWDIETLPKTVIESRGGVRMNRYPILLLDKEQLLESCENLRIDFS
jgi:ATP-dependent helicase HrpA